MPTFPQPIPWCDRLQPPQAPADPEEWTAAFDEALSEWAPWIGLYEVDHYLPRRAMRWACDSWIPWRLDSSYRPPAPPTPQHRLWFALISDCEGDSFSVFYPDDAKDGQRITVYADGEPISWTHGQEGLTRYEITPAVMQWMAGLAWIEQHLATSCPPELLYPF